MTLLLYIFFSLLLFFLFCFGRHLHGVCQLLIIIRLCARVCVSLCVCYLAFSFHFFFYLFRFGFVIFFPLLLIYNSHTHTPILLLLLCCSILSSAIIYINNIFFVRLETDRVFFLCLSFASSLIYIIYL